MREARIGCSGTIEWLGTVAEWPADGWRMIHHATNGAREFILHYHATPQALNMRRTPDDGAPHSTQMARLLAMVPVECVRPSMVGAFMAMAAVDGQGAAAA